MVGPAAFFSPAVGISGSTGPRSTLARVAERWASSDPDDALAIVGDIRDSVARATFETAVLRQWARGEPNALLAHVATLNADQQRRVLFDGQLLAGISLADPLHVLEIAPRFSPEIRDVIAQISMQALAQRDPLAALSYVDRMQNGMQRQQLLQQIARGYGQSDPEGALAWARGMPAQQPNLLAGVISGIGLVDPDRAFALASELTGPMERMQALQSVIATTVMRPDANVADIADRIIALGDRGMRDGTATMLLQMWSSRAPDDAMEWLLSNAGGMPPEVFQQIGQQAGMRDPRAAAAQTARVPAEARAQWIQGVAMGYAQNNAREAFQWLNQFRGEPVYANGVEVVLSMTANQDPATAARLLEEVGDELNATQAANLSMNIANNWANQDPFAAAEWALDRPSEPSRSMVVPNVVGTWSASDIAGARQWTLRLPEGQLRDSSLTMLLRTGSSNGTLDTSVLNAFSNEDARQQAVLQAISTTAYAEPVQARRMIDYYVTDPAIRLQAEQMLENARNGPRGMIGVSQGAIMNRAMVTQ
jgi:hypothetical protein